MQRIPEHLFGYGVLACWPAASALAAFAAPRRPSKKFQNALHGTPFNLYPPYVCHKL
jgi:hypothetical protein